MLMTGKEYLGSIRDGRRVYIGGELVEDVSAASPWNRCCFRPRRAALPVPFSPRFLARRGPCPD